MENHLEIILKLTLSILMAWGITECASDFMNLIKDKKINPKNYFYGGLTDLIFIAIFIGLLIFSWNIKVVK